jgi:threonine dehydratase
MKRIMTPHTRRVRAGRRVALNPVESRMPSPLPVTLVDIQQAQAKLACHIHRTPVVTSCSLDAVAGCRLHLKCENLQKSGSFKARGALNAVLGLTELEASGGVATQSSGNHGAALAMAARLRNIAATVVVPANAPRLKQEAMRSYGADLQFCDPTPEARDAMTRDVIARTGATLVHPFNDARVIAGQGTAVLELLTDRPQIQIVLAPVGGGGLLSGTLVAAKALRPGVTVIGCEPATADDAFRSWKAGRIIRGHADTLADGLRTNLAENTFAIIAALADEIMLASEAAIFSAMQLIWHRTKLLVEPSAAVPLAVILDSPQRFRGREVGMILSGGNVDPISMAGRA